MKYGYSLKRYECGVKIPTITMGGGNVCITSAHNQEDTTVSVVFSVIPSDICTGEISKEYQYVAVGESITKLNPLFDLTFTKIESIDTLISQLGVAREYLINMTKD